MKLLKYLPIALLAVVAAACSEDGPTPNEVAPGVYFAKANQRSFQATPLDATYEMQIKVCRTGDAVGEKVNFTYTLEKEVEAEDGTKSWQPADAADAAFFNVPSSVTFDNNWSMAPIKIQVNNADVTPWQFYRLTLTMTPDTKVSNYGKNTYSFTFVKVLDAWEDYGTAIYMDGWFLSLLTNPNTGEAIVAKDYPWEVPMQKNVGRPGQYRLVNTYSQPGLKWNFGNKFPTDEDAYILIDLTDPEFPIVGPSEGGVLFSSSPSVIFFNLEAYNLETGMTKEEAIADMDPEERSTFKDNVLTVPVAIADLGDIYVSGQPGVVIFPEKASSVAAKTQTQQATQFKAGQFLGKTYKR